MLKYTKDIDVRFSEVDSMGIVWHGHFIKFFEDGREAFGQKYDLGYMQVHEQGFFMPIVEVNCKYRKPISYKDKVAVETIYKDTPAAKVIFEYKIYNKVSNEVYATGNSVQIFLTKERELHLTLPDFFVEWKIEHGLLTPEDIQ